MGLPGPRTVREDDIPIFLLPLAVTFEIGSASLWSHRALDGWVHTESFTPALVKGPAAILAGKPVALSSLLPARL